MYPAYSLCYFSLSNLKFSRIWAEQVRSTQRGVPHSSRLRHTTPWRYLFTQHTGRAGMHACRCFSYLFLSPPETCCPPHRELPPRPSTSRSLKRWGRAMRSASKKKKKTLQEHTDAMLTPQPPDAPPHAAIWCRRAPRSASTCVKPNVHPPPPAPASPPRILWGGFVVSVQTWLTLPPQQLLRPPPSTTFFFFVFFYSRRKEPRTGLERHCLLQCARPSRLKGVLLPGGHHH